MRRAKLARVLHRTGAGWALKAFLPWSGLLCLNYHRIGNPRECQYGPDLFSATAEEFESQIRFTNVEFDPISPDDLKRCIVRSNASTADTSV